MTRRPEVFLIVLALALRLLVARAMPLIEVDGAYWCSLAENLADGDFAHGLSAAWPPLFPAAIAGMARVLEVFGAPAVPATFEWAARLVSVIAGTLLLLPLGSLAARLLPRPAVVITLLVAVVHPRLIEYSAAALSESLYCLALMSAIAALAMGEATVIGAGSAGTRPSPGATPAAALEPSSTRSSPAAGRLWQGLAGALFGAAFLARAEALPLALAMYAAGLAAPARRGGSRLRPAFLCGLMIVCAPWLYFLHARTGELTLGEKGSYNLWKANRVAYGRHYPQPRVLPQRVNRSPEIAPSAAPGEMRIGDLIRREPGVVIAHALSNLARIAYDSLPVVGTWPIALLAVAGMLVPRAGPWWLVLTPLVAVPLLVAPVSADRRFLVPLVPLLLLPLAGAAFAALARRQPRALAPTLVVLLTLGLSLYSAGISARADRAPEQRVAGEWLRLSWSHSKAARPIVMAHKPQVAFYAGGLIADLPDVPPDSILADARRTGVDVLVVDARGALGERRQLAPWLDSAHGPAGWRLFNAWEDSTGVIAQNHRTPSRRSPGLDPSKHLDGPPTIVLYTPDRSGYSAGSTR